jgi:hypothetical protein
MNATKAEIVMTVDGQTLKIEVAAENLEVAAAVRGFEVVGYYSNPRTRAELQGAPKFRGIVGPCYGGPGVVRYECPATYAELSA